MKNKAKKIFLLSVILVCFIGTAGITVAAETSNRAANIKSKGVFDFKNGEAIIDTTDLVYLADEIDLLEDTYKSEIVSVLNDIGTYYTSDGTITHDMEDSVISPESTTALAFYNLKDGILNSQSIPEEQTYIGILPGSDSETSGNISAATANELSLGAAAWVNGKLIIGTGEASQAYYNQGYADGLAQISNSAITYAYHIHNESCSTVCTVTSSSYSTRGSGTCPGCGDGGTHNMEVTIYTHSSCGNTNEETRLFCGGCDSWFAGKTNDITNRDHEYFICNKTEDTIESATITF